MKKSLLIASLLFAGYLIIGQQDSYSTDGSGQNQSGGAVSSVNGSSSASGGFTKGDQKTPDGFSSTTAQSKNVGASYQGNDPYSSTGLQPTSSCADTEGDLVTCSAEK